MGPGQHILGLTGDPGSWVVQDRPAFSRRVKIVCTECSSGWMSRLETRRDRSSSLTVPPDDRPAGLPKPLFTSWWITSLSALYRTIPRPTMASALDPALATPRVAVGSTDGCRAMLVGWLAGPELSAEEKSAVAAAWRLMDRSGISEAEDNPALPIGVRMLLRGSR